MRNKDSFEKNLNEQMDINRAYSKAVNFLNKYRVKLDGFIGEAGYFEDEVKADKKYVEEMKEKFDRLNSPEQKELNKLAVIFEAIVIDQSEMSEWFGPDGFSVPTSEFDDFKNGADGVIEFEENYLALGIDVTFSVEMEDKFRRIKKEIEAGKLTEIKYFVSEHTPPTKLPGIPRVVIGADAKTVKELSDLWLEGDKKKLATHPIQFQILEEIVYQLKSFADYAEEVGQKEAAKKYREELKKVSAIYQHKLSEVKDTGDRDEVSFNIESCARNFRDL
jgi:hypothetical protein